MAEGTQSARMRNFEALVSQPVGLTARGGRTFDLRDDVPTGILLRYQVLPSLADRWTEAEIALLAHFEAEAKEAEAREAREAAEAEQAPDGEQPVSAQFRRQREAKEWQLRQASALRDQMGAVRHRYESDVCALCGDIFRWTDPRLTDEELFGTWDEATWGWRGGVFSADEAAQIIQVFTNLRGIASLPQPSAPGERPSATESSPATPNRARRRAALAR
jgi:hypothetical protein